MTTIKLLCSAVVVALFCFTGAVQARIARAWTYAQLADRADVVIIATATKTTVTKTKESMLDSSFSGLRAATEFAVVTTFKGKPQPTLVLHHVWMRDALAQVNGPGLVTFEPSSHVQYLMFLVKDKDGEYLPASGQTDPIYSIEPLRARAESIVPSP